MSPSLASFWAHTSIACDCCSDERACTSDDLIRRGSDLRMELSAGSFDLTRGALDQQLGDLNEIVGEHRSTNKQFEVLGAFGGEATLHSESASRSIRGRGKPKCLVRLLEGSTSSINCGRSADRPPTSAAHAHSTDAYFLRIFPRTSEIRVCIEGRGSAVEGVGVHLVPRPARSKRRRTKRTPA